MLPDTPGTDRKRKQSLSRLLVAFTLIAMIWGWLLPSLSDRPTVKTRLEFLDARGIDASAMYYTELEAMDVILDRYEGRGRRN